MSDPREAVQWRFEPVDEPHALPPDSYEVLAPGATHVCYTQGRELAEHITTVHNTALSRQGQRDRHNATRSEEYRLTHPWQADSFNVETRDGQYAVGTVTSVAVANHIAELHNRTLGEGQESPPDLPPDLTTYLTTTGAEEVNLGLRDLRGQAGCAPGCDFPITGYHAKRGGQVLCRVEPATAEEATRRLAEGLQIPRELLGQEPREGAWLPRPTRPPALDEALAKAHADGSIFSDKGIEPTVAPGWPDEHMLEAALGLLASAGPPPHQPVQWKEAQGRWIRAYHRLLDAHRDPDALLQQLARENAARNRVDDSLDAARYAVTGLAGRYARTRAKAELDRALREYVNQQVHERVSSALATRPGTSQ